MKITKEIVTSTEVTLSIEMNSEDEDPFLNRSYRRTVGRLQIPGFRKGKAPRSIVENYVGRTALVQEALEFMIPETLDQVLKDEELQAFVEPQIEVLEIEPVSFKAVVPLEPQVDLGDFRSIRLEREPVEVDDERVSEVLEQLRREAAPWEPADRTVRFGDLLNLNVQGSVEGDQVVDDQGVDYVPQQENVLPFPGFSIYLEGMTEGQEKNFTLSIPEDYPRPQFAGKDCRFQVEVLSVKEKHLPELDDEFAKGVGEGYDDLEALRNHLRQRMTEEAEAEATRQLEQQSLDELVKRASVQASDMLFQRELELMQQERERALRNQRLDMDTYLSYIGKTEEEFQEQLRPSAQERLTRYLVMRKLAQEEGIEVSPEEVQEEIDSLVSSSGESQDAMRRALSTDNARDNLHSSLVERKVIQRLTDIVQGLDETSGVETATALEPEDNEGPAAAEAAAPSDTPDLEPSITEPQASENEGAKPNA